MIRRGAVLLLVALTVGLLPASPAVASTTGEVVFHCTFHAPAWPSSYGHATCQGTAVVSVSGIDNSGTPYTLVGPGPFSMVFEYQTPCIVGEPPLLWTANGMITVGPVLAVRGSALRSATLTAPFQTSGGAESAFTTTNHQVQFSDGATATGSNGFGEMTTALLLSANNTCPAGGPVQGVIEGRWHRVM